MRIVVTGATGNTGTALLRLLRREGVEVVGISRRPPVPGGPYAGVEWHSIDIGGADAAARLSGAFRGADAVVHLAWFMQPSHHEPLRELNRVNVGGTANVLAAVAASGVRHVVCACSVASYGPGSKGKRVTESWPTGGIPSSHYSRQKAAVERLLDRFEEQQQGIIVTRIRPGLIFQADAARCLADRFLRPIVPVRLLRRVPLPFLPIPAQAITHALHADDAALAYWLAVATGSGGAFNIAADDLLDAGAWARGFGAARSVHIPRLLLRSVMWWSWQLRLQRMDPGWLDLTCFLPLMSSERAKRELGWAPARGAEDSLTELIDGMAAGRGVRESPVLWPQG